MILLGVTRIASKYAHNCISISDLTNFWNEHYNNNDVDEIEKKYVWFDQ